METISLTIATASFNAGVRLDHTRCSVRESIDSLSGIEYLVIDGNSQDGSLQELLEYPEPYERVVSEPDKGIYDAFNKALNLARGQYLLFIGAGDMVDPGGLRELVSLCATGAGDIIQGDIQQLFPGGKLGKRRRPKFNWLWLRGSHLCHPAMCWQ